MHNESNMIGDTWATDSWEERCDLLGPLLWVHSWGRLGVLGASWGDLVAFWDGLRGDLGASWGDLVSPAPTTGLGGNAFFAVLRSWAQLNSR